MDEQTLNEAELSERDRSVEQAESLIRSRRSVRTFDGGRLSDINRSALEKFFKLITNPFGDQVEFKLLDAEKDGVTSQVIVGCDDYIAAKVKRSDTAAFAFGCAFEKLCLFAESIGLGTVMLAGTLDRDAFKRAMDLNEDEIFWCATPVGRPADKMSTIEKTIRAKMKSDERIPFHEVFFDGDFDHPLPDPSGLGDEPAKEDIAEALELVRLAPSARNKQPLRAVRKGSTVHFYEQKGAGLTERPEGDIQQVDLGIACSHFLMYIESAGHQAELKYEDPKLSDDPSLVYAFSFEVK